jgi:hypothetical protein
MKQGWAFAWRSLMAAEIFVTILTGFGLGQLLQYGRELLAMDQVVAIMLIIIAIGLLADRLLFSPWERFFHKRWAPAPRRIEAQHMIEVRHRGSVELPDLDLRLDPRDSNRSPLSTRAQRPYRPPRPRTIAHADDTASHGGAHGPTPAGRELHPYPSAEVRDSEKFRIPPAACGACVAGLPSALSNAIRAAC